MYTRSLGTTTKTLLDHADKIGARIPKPLRNEIDELLTMAKTLNSTTFATETLAEAVVAAIRAGENPVTSARVQAANLAATLDQNNASGQLAETLMLTLHGILAANIDTIIDAFKPAYKKAGDRYTAAHTALTERGIDTGIDTPDIINYGRDVAAAAADGRAAQWELNDTRTKLSALIVATNKLPGHRYGLTSVWFTTGTARGEQITKALDYWDALNAGWTIELRNLTEAETGVQAARQYEADDEAEHEDDYRKPFRNPALAEVAKMIRPHNE